MTGHALHLTAAVTHEGEWYVARCFQVEVTSQGETIEESLANLREALELYFEDAPAPDVTDVITAPVEVHRVSPAPTGLSGATSRRSSNAAGSSTSRLAAAAPIR